ncbi:hypothetical protein ALC53_05171 [Atta colombica]|uniref:Uncharacterized protein n=1 Tax=Atta colombica TaxID=520822 RepID=A0A151I424_9HYME|nr:hypothetical protein ALC53_05171 [Atta colombica]
MKEIPLCSSEECYFEQILRCPEMNPSPNFAIKFQLMFGIERRIDENNNINNPSSYKYQPNGWLLIFLRMLTYSYSIYALHHNTSTGRTDDHGRFIQYQRDIDLFYLERQSESIESFLQFIRSMTQIIIIIRLFLNVFIVVINSIFRYDSRIYFEIALLAALVSLIIGIPRIKN